MAYEKNTGSPASGSDKGPLIYAEARASGPELTEGEFAPLTQTLDGRLRVDGGGGGTPFGVNVQDYGALGTAVENDCFATISGSNDTVTIYNYDGLITLEELDGEILLTIVTVEYSGVAFQPYHCNQWLYLKVGAYTLKAHVLRYIDSDRVTLDATDITPITASSGTWLCPCFLDSNEGQYLVWDGMGQYGWLANGVMQRRTNTAELIGQAAFEVIISDVIAPDSVRVAVDFPFPAKTDAAARMRWGPNDLEAVSQAAVAAVSTRKQILIFPGTGLYLLLGIGSTAEYLIYVPEPETECNAALGWTNWISPDGAKTYTTSSGGQRYFKVSAPVNASTSRVPDQMIFGPATFRRGHQLTTINVAVFGDSEAILDANLEGGCYLLTHNSLRAFKNANRNKTVNCYVCSVGGSTFASIVSNNVRVQDAVGAGVGFTVPKPIVGIHPLLDFVSELNFTGSGPSIVPDVIFTWISGVNDHRCVSGADMHYWINSVQAVSHGDAFGSTDIVMMYDRGVIYRTRTLGLDGGFHVGSIYQPYYAEYAGGLFRSTALNLGLGFLDVGAMDDRACMGFDPMQQTMVRVPSLSATASPTAPMQFPYECRDFKFWLRFPDLLDPAFPGVDIQVSPNFGNNIMLRKGANGHLWYLTSTWGIPVATTCSITMGGNVLTVGAATDIFTGQTINVQARWPQFTVLADIFNSSHTNKYIVAPTGHSTFGGGRTIQRNVVRNFLDTKTLMLHDGPANAVTLSAVTGSTVSIGGAQFIPDDSFSQPDVTIFYADGTIFNTQVAAGGYISATQATLVDNAPQALVSQVVDVHIGRIGIKPTDSGINLSTSVISSHWQIEVQNYSIMIGRNVDPPNTLTYFFCDAVLERYGQVFYPVITPMTPANVSLLNIDVEEYNFYLPTAIASGLRGTPTSSNSYYSFGAGSHSGPLLAPQVYQPAMAAQNWST